MSQFNQHMGCYFLVFSYSKIFESHITHTGTILKMYLRTGVSLCLEGRMMLTVINMTKVFIRGDNVEVAYFLRL